MCITIDFYNYGSISVLMCRVCVSVGSLYLVIKCEQEAVKPQNRTSDVHHVVVNVSLDAFLTGFQMNQNNILKIGNNASPFWERNISIYC